MQDLTPFLDGYSQDLTTLAQDGKLDSVIGRSDEIGELIEVLCQGTAVLLVGRASVDKTTIVEGLAERITMHNVPDPLLTKHVRQTDMGILIHGSYKPGFNELSTRLTEAFRLSESIMYIEIFKFFKNQEVVKILEALL